MMMDCKNVTLGHSNSDTDTRKAQAEAGKEKRTQQSDGDEDEQRTATYSVWKCKNYEHISQIRTVNNGPDVVAHACNLRT